MQRFKTIYFPDHPAPSPKARNLKVAFGPGDERVFERVRLLSSEELRNLLGCSKFAELRSQASAVGLPLNTFCLRQLRRLSDAESGPQYSLPDFGTAEARLSIDPIQATFRGGLHEPLHDWYPYLEGYSPDFVHNLLGEFASGAKHVLDPFAGTGTTPLTATRAGLAASYCELNPLLQYLVEVKCAAITASQKKRSLWSVQLCDASQRLLAEVGMSDEDVRLREAYVQTFGTSEFFTESTFGEVLRLRTWLDGLAFDLPELAPFATVATLASLVPASELIRKGDLRFRKSVSEMNVKTLSLCSEVANRIRAMASDIESLESVALRPRLVSCDAKDLASVPPLDVDAIITSPPYLNGTNYYRNTKIELWFLRALSGKNDLARFRRTTVTAGINDVTATKQVGTPHALVEAVLRMLKETAYDQRIPLMVAGYFSDMSKVFDGLAPHVKPGCPLLLDIGDSDYGGVKVNTPLILAQLLEDRGWQVHEEIVLRQRLSKGGGRLRQALIVATAPHRRTRSMPRPPRWQSQLNSFIRELPHQRGTFAKRNWGSPLHSLCSYQGKMKPALAHHLVTTFTQPGHRILDPFGGVGTIAFEGAVHGARTFSFDISPAAVPIATAKLCPTSCDEVKSRLTDLEEFVTKYRPTRGELEEAHLIKFNGRLVEYFHPQTFQEILAARRYFATTPPNDPASALIFASLLHVLHGNRPYALSRRSHPITPFAPTGAAVYKSLIEKVSEKVVRVASVERGAQFQPGLSLFQDATSEWPDEVDNLDAIITSPPFFDSTRFYLANWMRLWFAGWGAGDFRTKPKSFIDERQKADFRVYEPILRQARERLVAGGVCVMHLGKSKKCDMAPIIAEVAKTWFGNVQIFSENVGHCESHGIRDKGTVVEHTYLVLH